MNPILLKKRQNKNNRKSQIHQNVSQNCFEVLGLKGIYFHAFSKFSDQYRNTVIRDPSHDKCYLKNNTPISLLLQCHFPGQGHNNKCLLFVTICYIRLKASMPSKQALLSKASWFLNPNLCVFPGKRPQPDWSLHQAPLSHPPPALQLVKAHPGPHIPHTLPMQMHRSSTGFLDYNLVLFINLWYFFRVLPCVEDGTQPVGHTVIIKSHHYHTQSGKW